MRWLVATAAALSTSADAQPSRASTINSSVSPPQVASGKNCSKTARYALALRGGVSKLGRDSHGAGTAYFNEGRAVNVTIIRNALQQHLFEPNGGRSRFDVFIHSWSYDLAPLMTDLYKPVNAVFENQSSPKIRSQILARMPQGDRSRPKGYSPFSGVASFLSMQKVLALVRNHENYCAFRYSRIILYRPDVLIWGGDMELETYDEDRVTANQHDSIGTGDFHWVFSSELARRFRPYDSLSKNSELFFGYVRDYIQREVTPDVPPAVDGVKPCGRCIQGGPCQEVYRKICKCKRRAITYLGYDEAEATTMGCRPKDKSRKTALRDVTR